MGGIPLSFFVNPSLKTKQFVLCLFINPYEEAICIFPVLRIDTHIGHIRSCRSGDYGHFVQKGHYGLTQYGHTYMCVYAKNRKNVNCLWKRKSKKYSLKWPMSFAFLSEIQNGRHFINFAPIFLIFFVVVYYVCLHVIPAQE